MHSHGGTCGSKPCWEKTSVGGFRFKTRASTPDGASGLKLASSLGGRATIQFKGRGSQLDLPELTAIAGPLVLQIANASSGKCWSAVFSAPFAIQESGRLRAATH